MKTKLFLLLVLFLATINISIAFQEKQDFKVLFEKAKYTMETKADLKEAINLFESLIKTYPNEKEYVTKSLLYQGMCYEKLGNQEAVKKYQRLVDNFPGQKNEVAIARERLSRLILIAEKVSQAPLIPKFTKINIPTKLYESVKLSPDGKNLALVSSSDKKLYKLPLSGNIGPNFPGTPVHLSTEGIEVDYQTGLSWSNDGKWIAFTGVPLSNKQNQGIYIVSSNGGKPEKVVENYRSERLVNYRISLSPDGKELAYSSVEDSKQYIYSISVDESVPKQLVDIQTREPVFSPDGKMIAYVEDKNLGSREGELGLWIIPAQGGTPHLVADAGMASSPVWSPDGKMIVFLDYSHNKEINIIPVSKDGKAAGKVTTIDVPEGIELVRLMAGWTPNNKIGVLLKTKQEFALYTLPAKGGQAAMVLHDCYALQPRWSKDGKQIFYTTPPLEGQNRGDRLALASVSVEGGSRKLLSKGQERKNLRQLAYQGGNRVSPDGKMIISAAWTPKDTTLIYGNPKTRIWKIPVDGSDPIHVTNKQEQFIDLCPSWSPDGKTIAFIRNYLIEDLKPRDEYCMYMVKSTGGNPELLLREPDQYIMSPVWSPDGKMIAYLTKEKELPQNNLLNIINVNNGNSRVIGEVPNVFVNIELAWSPDSKRIAFNDLDGKVIKIMSLSDGSIEDINTNLVDVKIYHLDWSPDGERFVFSGWKGGNRELWFMEDFLPLEKLSQKIK